MRDLLITKDSKGKARYVDISNAWKEDHYEIVRFTGQIGGKNTPQPVISVSYGKQKRTVTEQADLEYNALIKKYMDKGYKRTIGLTLEDTDKIEEFVESLGDSVTDSKGLYKPMLAKQADKVAVSVFDKKDYWLASRKLDGIRLLLYKKDGEILSSSRGGNDYNDATEILRNQPEIKQVFDKYPDIILDGEYYKHGWHLSKLSGLARLKDVSEQQLEDIEQIQYWVYDIIDLTKTAQLRINFLMSMAKELNIPIYTGTEVSSPIVILEQAPVTGWTSMKKLHDKYVKDGFEGLVIRDPDALYKPNGRTNSMIKIKEYDSESFKITGWAPGLRGVEDMCFILVTKEGKEFKAKPMGDLYVKQQYVDQMDDIIGKWGDVKFFNYSVPENIPTQPTFVTVRDDLE